MSPQNILAQNVVFDVPLSMTLERLEEKLTIDGSFVKSITIDKMHKRIESSENLIAIDTQVIDLIPKDMLKQNVKSLELLLSDSIVVPTMSK